MKKTMIIYRTRERYENGEHVIEEERAPRTFKGVGRIIDEKGPLYWFDHHFKIIGDLEGDPWDAGIYGYFNPFDDDAQARRGK